MSDCALIGDATQLLAMTTNKKKEAMAEKNIVREALKGPSQLGKKMRL